MVSVHGRGHDKGFARGTGRAVNFLVCSGSCLVKIDLRGL